jgi:hypothetical protein
MAVVIAAVGVILSTVAFCLGTLLRTQRTIGAELATHQGIARLARHFRTDVHRANDAIVNGNTVRLPISEQQHVEYAFIDNDVRRTVLKNDEILHRDRFRLPRVQAINWHVDRDNTVSAVSMRLIRKTDVDDEVGEPLLQIEASVGLDNKAQ